MQKWTIGLGALALCAACSDPKPDDEPQGFGGDAGVRDAGDDPGRDAGEGANDGGDAPDADGGDTTAADGGGGPTTPEGCIAPSDWEAPEGYPTFAVHNSDYTTASVSLLDETGTVLDAVYLDADSDLERLPQGLHGDVGLPTSPGAPRVLAVIARSGGDYVLRMDLDEGEVLERIATQADPFDMEDPGAAWASNPQDYLYVDESTAFVTRFEPNQDPDAPAMQAGDDILEIDPSTGERVDRIALTDWVETVEVDDGEGGSLEKTLYARPGSLLGMGCYALLGTSRLSGDLRTGNDQGAVGVLDLRERSVTKVEIDTLRNCGTLRPVVDDPQRALVQCSGSNPYGDPGSAGIALVHLDAEGSLEVEHTLLREGEDDPVLNSGVVSLGGSRVVAVAPGDFAEGTGDTAYVVDLESGEREELFTASGAFVVGSGTYDPVRERLYLPDAEVGLRVFELKDGAFEEQDALELDPTLPPRAVRPLRAL